MFIKSLLFYKIGIVVSVLWFGLSDPARDNLLLLSSKPQNSKMIITKLPLFLPSVRKLFTLNNASKQKIIMKNFYFGISNWKCFLIILLMLLLPSFILLCNWIGQLIAFYGCSKYSLTQSVTIKCILVKI